uniref:C-type lectin domain-containing protein n=1 Tax=Panagrolaimus davidi TaxID=227884 RepID=A0A914R1R5_9BILA
MNFSYYYVGYIWGPFSIIFLLLAYAYAIWYGHWLGIRSFDSGKTWKTDDGSAADFLEYGKWCKGYPPTHSNELCVAVQPLYDGCYQAADCSNATSHYYSICQKQGIFY